MCNPPVKADPIVMLEVDPTPIVGEKGVYWVGISAMHYENLSINLQRILANLRQKNAMIYYYERCISEHNINALKK